MLQVGRSGVRSPMALDFSIYLIWELTQPPTIISTTNFPGGGGKTWPARNADNLTAICELIV
jgi:hypothetical protein